MRRFIVAASVIAALIGVPSHPRPAPAAPAVASNVHVFYYPWYGNPGRLGNYRHWQQGEHAPPLDIGANYYPALGAYDSGDFAGAVARQMDWIRDAGVGVIVYSWWGQGSYEDQMASGVLNVAAQYGIRIAWHLENYDGRSAESTVADIDYINARYGSSPAFYRDAEHGDRPAFYVYSSVEVTDWSALERVRAGNIVLAQTTDTTRAAHFGGMYTYDGFAGAVAPGWKNAAAYCRAHGLVWAPSVSPGYVDDRAVLGNTTPTLERDNGATYDMEWRNALSPATGGAPTWVTITSFNEWHEGSSIEPASSDPPAGRGYLTFSGAYGKTGAAAETAYLDRTLYWVNQFSPVTTKPSAATAFKAHANGRHVTAENAGNGALSPRGDAVGLWEQFDRVDAGNGTIALRARVNGRYVSADRGGAAPLVANRAAIGLWETFQLVDNADGSVSLRALANNRYVTVDRGGSGPLVASRTAIGPWEEFDLMTP